MASAVRAVEEQGNSWNHVRRWNVSTSNDLMTNIVLIPLSFCTQAYHAQINAVQLQSSLSEWQDHLHPSKALDGK
jgi:hypothetical protein